MLNFSARIKNYLAEQFNLPEEQVETMLPEFKKTLRDHLAHLEEVHKQDNLANLAKAAHTIKGAFLNLGLRDCADLAMKIEDKANQGDRHTDYPELISSIGSIVKEIVEE